MAQFLAVPPQRLQADVLAALLEEYASRDGTDYGERETPLDQRVATLLKKVQRGDIQILFDSESEQWDLLPQDQAAVLLNS